MNIRPCPADRARAIGRVRKGVAKRVRRHDVTVEVRMGCGCIFEVDFAELGLATALEKSIKNKMKH